MRASWTVWAVNGVLVLPLLSATATLQGGVDLFDTILFGFFEDAPHNADRWLFRYWSQCFPIVSSSWKFCCARIALSWSIRALFNSSSSSFWRCRIFLIRPSTPSKSLIFTSPPISIPSNSFSLVSCWVFSHIATKTDVKCIALSADLRIPALSNDVDSRNVAPLLPVIPITLSLASSSAFHRRHYENWTRSFEVSLLPAAIADFVAWTILGNF